MSRTANQGDVVEMNHIERPLLEPRHNILALMAKLTGLVPPEQVQPRPSGGDDVDRVTSAQERLSPTFHIGGIPTEAMRSEEGGDQSNPQRPTLHEELNGEGRGVPHTPGNGERCDPEVWRAQGWLELTTAA